MGQEELAEFNREMAQRVKTENAWCIYKYHIPVCDRIELSIPQGATILTVQLQNGQPCLWAMVRPANERKMRAFVWLGTGNPISPDLINGTMCYIGTIQQIDAVLVFHLFEVR